MKEIDTFAQRLNGKFEGVLRWEQLDNFWSIVKDSSTPWYFYQVGSTVPEVPLELEEFNSSLEKLDALLHQEHDYDFCGLVYADNLSEPTLIKVFDPNNLGSSCGCSGKQIPPRWIISHYKPSEIIDDAPTPNNRKHWWKQLFHLK